MFASIFLVWHVWTSFKVSLGMCAQSTHCCEEKQAQRVIAENYLRFLTVPFGQKESDRGVGEKL